jgi:hypothetical protein
MGVKGLLTLLSSASENVSLKDFAGKIVAIDMYCWLHKGAIACAKELALGMPTTKHITYCIRFLHYLLSCDITPIVVFDGDVHPMKLGEEKERAARRAKNLDAAKLLDGTGDSKRTHRHYSMAVDITPDSKYAECGYHVAGREILPSVLPQPHTTCTSPYWMIKSLSTYFALQRRMKYVCTPPLFRPLS